MLKKTACAVLRSLDVTVGAAHKGSLFMVVYYWVVM